jgi:hypothetical protein
MRPAGGCILVALADAVRLEYTNAAVTCRFPDYRGCQAAT